LIGDEEMSADPTVAVPVSHLVVEAQTTPAAEAPAPPAATPEQVQAIDNVLSQEQEAKQVAGLLGLYTGAVVLHDLAVETFRAPANEEEEVEKKRPEPEA
jgi:hypothetical protein